MQNESVSFSLTRTVQREQDLEVPNENETELDSVDGTGDRQTSVGTVTSDITRIYEDGKYTQISIDKFVDNPVAISMLINAHNEAKAGFARLQEESAILKSERVAYRLQPKMRLLWAVISVISLILIGIGINEVSSVTGRGIGIIITIIGIILNLFCIYANTIYPRWVRKTSEELSTDN